MNLKISLLRLILLLGFFEVSATYATGVIKLSKNEVDIIIDKRYIEVFEDSGNCFSIEQVSSPGFSSLFEPITAEYPTNSNTSSAYWVRFTVDPRKAGHEQFLLESFTFRINQIDFFKPTRNGYEQISTGDQYEFGKRVFKHKNFQFLLPVASQPYTCYVRFKTNESHRIMLVIRSFQQFTGYALSEYFLLGLFYGIVLIIAIYNLFLFFTIREKAYLYYVFYVLSVGLYAMGQDGTGFQYLWSGSPDFNFFASPLFLFSLVFWLLMYTREFLPVREKLPHINKLVNVYLILRFGVFLLSITFYPKLKNIVLIDLPTFFFAYYISVQCFLRGFKPARYFVTGFSLLFISFAINGLMYAKLISPSIFTVYSMNAGVVGEMILLSIALAERVRVFRQDKLMKERENQILEQMVGQRTLELKLANEKLLKQAQEIETMNHLLFADNKKLSEDVRRISTERVMQKEMGFEEFSRIYPDEQTCFHFLSELKWQKGYRCIRCGNNSYSNGKTNFSRRCSRCGYDESVSAYTIFHALKFPITKAFYMLFLVVEHPDITVEELAEKLTLTVKTCWGFKKKVLDAYNTQKPARGTKGRKKIKWSSLILSVPARSTDS